jgi:hypothetical protein
MGRELPDRGTEAHRGQLLRRPRHSLHLTELPVMGHRGNRATEYLSVENSVSTPLRTARRWRKHQLAFLLANRVIGHAPPPAVGRRYGSVCEQRSNVFRRGKLVLGQLGPTWERIKESSRFNTWCKNRPVRPFQEKPAGSTGFSRFDCTDDLLSEPDQQRLWFSLLPVQPPVRS